jgi:hypothetical protein
MTNEKGRNVIDKRPLKSLAAILATVTATLLAGCDGVGLFGLFGTKCPWPVTDSRIAYATRFEGDPIYWLDNDRVLVPGYERRADVPAGKEAPEQFGPLGLYIWDTRNSTATRHSDLSQHYSLCYNDGFITYTTSDDNGRRRHQSEGEFGKEQALPVDARPSFDAQPAYSSCPRIDPAKRLRPEHTARHVPAWFLKVEDGYVSAGEPRIAGDSIPRERLNDKVNLYRPGGSEPVALPIISKEVFFGTKLTYSQFAQRYVLVPHTSRNGNPNSDSVVWPDKQPMPVYLISPTGDVQTISVPHGTWVPPHMATPTKQGLFIASSNAPSTNSRQAGGWLLKDGRMVKLFDHLVDAAGVSPDGCKIAFSYNDFNPKTNNYTQVIDLCR